MAKPKGGAEIPGQVRVPQMERYKGSDVLGMEETTARPMGYETGANPPVYQPEPSHRPVFCYHATVKGYKVATFEPKKEE